MYKFDNFRDAYKESRKYNKKGKTAYFPPYCTFELTNTCNLRCIICPTTYLKRNKNELDFELFKKVVDEISYYKSLIRFIGYDEPLLYSRIKDVIQYVKAKNLLLHLTTNGSLLNKEIIETIVDTRVDSIIFSFQGFTKEEYCTMRNVKPDTYQKVINNIRLLYNSRQDNKLSIKITTTITDRDNPEDKDKFIKAHLNYADEVQISGFTHLIPIGQLFGKNDVWEKLKINKPKKIAKLNCFIPNYEMIIRADGNVYPCCSAFNEDLLIGNIKEDTLFDIWHSKRAKEIRETVGRGDLERYQDCTVCPIRYEHENIGNTVTNIMEDRCERYKPK